MASTALTCSASPLVSKRASSTTLSSVGFGTRSILPPSTPAKTPSSSRSLVVKAQQGGGLNREQITTTPAAVDWHKRVALLDTSPYVRAPWDTAEDDNEIRMWFDMPGVPVEDIQVNIVDDTLIIKAECTVDALGRKVYSPYDAKIQLPAHCLKEETRAVLKNGVLYIHAPKITKFEHRVIPVPVRAE